MNRAIFIAVTGTLLGAALASGAVVTGTIVDDATGAPLAQCEVRVFGTSQGKGLRFGESLAPDTFRAFTTFDSVVKGGSFETEDLKPGEYTIAVGHLGYVYTSTSLQITGDDAGPPLHIRLVPLAAIEGHLTGMQGWTGRVTALSKSIDKTTGKEMWKPFVDEILRPTPIDNEGNFRIPDLPPGTYALLVAYSNSGILRYPEGNGGLEIRGDGEAFRVRVPIPASSALRTIEGQVELPDPKDWYWVTLSNPDQPALAVATTMTDNAGGFAFRGIVPGNYVLLSSPGQLERGTPPIETPPYHGFARTNVDLREHDARGVVVKPQQSIPASVALEETFSVPRSEAQCHSAMVTLMPLEDWGVRMARRQSPFLISSAGVALAPQSFDGLAPARYGVSTESVGGGCLVADHPVLDLTQALSGNLEAKVREPGTLRGHADAGAELILIPEDFAEGWSYLPSMWFLEVPFGADLHFRQQAIWQGGGPFLPHSRMAAANTDGHFEFRYVPAGMYRVAFRAAGPLTDWQATKRVEITAAGIAAVEIATPGAPVPRQ